MAFVSAGPFEGRSLRNALFFLLCLLAGCNHFVRISAAGAPGLSQIGGAGDMLGFAIGSLNTTRINAGYVVQSTAKYCPTSISGACIQTFQGINAVFGMNP